VTAFPGWRVRGAYGDEVASKLMVVLAIVWFPFVVWRGTLVYEVPFTTAVALKV
jgi:hypothetical protein